MVPIEFYDRDVETEDVVAALQRDGSVVVREQVEPEIAEKVSAGGAGIQAAFSLDVRVRTLS